MVCGLPNWKVLLCKPALNAGAAVLAKLLPVGSGAELLEAPKVKVGVVFVAGCDAKMELPVCVTGADPN